MTRNAPSGDTWAWPSRNTQNQRPLNRIKSVNALCGAASQIFRTSINPAWGGGGLADVSEKQASHSAAPTQQTFKLRRSRFKIGSALIKGDISASYHFVVRSRQAIFEAPREMTSFEIKL